MPVHVKDDFEKLFLAWANLRLMIFDCNFEPGSEALAETFAECARQFSGTSDSDNWLLAAWERYSETRTWAFKYFTITPDGHSRQLS